MKPKRKKWLALAALFCALLVAVYWKISSPRFILEHANQLTLYSLEPGLGTELDNSEAKSRYQNSKKFCSEVVLGKVIVTNPATKRQLVNALYKSINESKGEEALCFDPRHGIHAKWLGQTVDVLICFSCLQVNFCSSRCEHEALTDSAQPLFNKVLDDAKIPRSKPRD